MSGQQLPILVAKTQINTGHSGIITATKYECPRTAETAGGVVERRWRSHDMRTISIPLSQGKFAIIDEEDYDLVNGLSWFADCSNGYWYAKAYFRSLKQIKRMHRVILGAPKGVLVDHIDGDGLNNTRANLRLATRSQNSANSRLYASNRTGYRGVYPERGNRWRAAIGSNGKFIYLGCFGTKLEAAIAYDSAARELHGEFAVLNFPEGQTNV